MAKITVHNIAGLSEYSTAIKTFSEHYTSAINETARSFETKIEGDYSEAISAFLERLNQLQTTVFDYIPEALSQYATVIATYEDSLRDAGFQTKAWTDDVGAEAVVTELTGTQLYELDDVAAMLQKVLNQASEALDYSTVSLRPVVDRTERGLSDAANQRKQKDDMLQLAYYAFINGLDASIQTFTDLERPLTNALYTIRIPVSTVMTAIKNRTFTANELYYFDALQSETDVAAITLLLSESDEVSQQAFFKKLGELEGDKLSLGAITAVYGRLLEEIPTEDAVRQAKEGVVLTNIETFLIALSHQDKAAASAYLKGLTAASAQLTTYYKSQALSLIPPFPKAGANQAEYEVYWTALQDNQSHVQTINGLMKRAGFLGDIVTLSFMEHIGTKQHSVTYETRFSANRADDIYQAAVTYQSQISLKKGSLMMKPSNEGELAVHMGFTAVGEELSENGFRQDRRLSAVNVSNQAELHYKKTADRAKELLLAKEEAIKALQGDTLKSVFQSATGVIAPEWTIITGLAETFSENNSKITQISVATNDFVQEYTAEIPGLSQADQNKIKGSFERGTRLVETIGSIHNYYDKAAAISNAYHEAIQEALKEEKEMKQAILFNYGGTHVTVEGHRATNFSYLTPDYDLEATLQQYDMEQNGLRAQVFRDAAGASKTVTQEMMRELDYFDQIAIREEEDILKSLLGRKQTSGHTYTADEIKLGIEKLYSRSKYAPSVAAVMQNRYFEEFVRGVN